MLTIQSLQDMPENQLRSLVWEKCSVCGRVKKISVVMPTQQGCCGLACVTMETDGALDKVATSVGDFKVDNTVIIRLMPEDYR